MAARLGCAVADIVDFSANINPLGPPAWLRSVLARTVSELHHYPEPRSTGLCQSAAACFGLTADQIVAGNGSSELLFALPRLCAARGIERALLPAPCYGDYARACAAAGLMVEHLVLDPDDNFTLDWDKLASSLHTPAVVILGQPGNPAGTVLDPQRIVNLAADKPRCLFVVDEAFADFLPDLPRLARCLEPNILVLHSLTKFYALPGLRLGLAYGNPDLCAALSALLPDWSVSALAQAVGHHALHDHDYAQRTTKAVTTLRAALHTGLTDLGLRVFPGAANYLLCQCTGPWSGLNAYALQEELFGQRILIRNCATYTGLDASYFRLAVRTKAENTRLLCALAKLRPGHTAPAPKRAPKPVPALMVQGLTSNAGKSVLAAGLCRVLTQDGLRVAPFKAQNMSLNSFVTAEGKEMGRAQVVQAQACGLAADVRMNPVLLKPKSDTGSQVIVLGKAIGSMSVGQYIRYKAELFPVITQAYDQLAAVSQVMILEGAGSPAEVNLKAHDVVNMAMARHAQAAVLLAGDIDRGGVFASCVGTMEVLEEWERALVAGFIINRFRGQQSLLAPAIDYVRAFTGVETLGVVPFMPDLGLPEEDSVSFKARPITQPGPDPANTDTVTIAVPDLPHISNFTDFHALELEPDVRVRIARCPEHLEGADAIILPGSRNVRADLEFLWATGLAQAIQTSPAERIGLCGGLQMLGQSLTDPCQVESAGPARPLGLLPLITELAVDKELRQTKACYHDPGHTQHLVYGYEIHHGQTQVHEGAVQPCVTRPDGAVIGWARPDGQTWGTYLHGIFDDDLFRRFFVNRLRQRKGLPALAHIQVSYDIDAALDRLAQVLRSSLDMPRIYRLLGL